MTKSLFEYFDPEKDSYEYTVKIAQEADIDDNDLTDCLECALERYTIVALEHIDTSPIQKTVECFPNYRNIRVATFRIAVEYPMSIRQLQNAVTDQFGIADGQVIVSKDYDPSEDNADSVVYDDDEDREALLADPDYSEAEELEEELHGNQFFEDNNEEIRQGAATRQANLRVWQSDLIPSEKREDVEKDGGVQYNHNERNLSPMSMAYLNTEKEYQNEEGQLSPLLRESIQRLRIPKSEKALLMKAIMEEKKGGKDED